MVQILSQFTEYYDTPSAGESTPWVIKCMMEATQSGENVAVFRGPGHGLGLVNINTFVQLMMHHAKPMPNQSSHHLLPGAKGICAVMCM